MSRRSDKISDVILKELGHSIQTEIRDPRIGFVTLSRVKISEDLAHADVFVSVLGSPKEEADTLAGLKSSAGYLRRHLSKAMTTRTVPKLNFVIDKGLEHSEKIHEILSHLKEDDELPEN